MAPTKNASAHHRVLPESFAQAVDGVLRRLFFHDTGIGEVATVRFVGRQQPVAADADEPEVCAVGLASQQGAARLEQPAGQLCRREAGHRAAAQPEVGGLELEADARSAPSLGSKPAMHFLAEGKEFAFEPRPVGDVLVEGGLGGHALGLPPWRHRARIDPHGELVQPPSLGAKIPHQACLAAILQVADARDAVARQALLGRLADAPDQRHRARAQEGLSLGAADDGEAARFVEIGRNLREELAIAESDGDAHADLGLDSPRQAGEA